MMSESYKINFRMDEIHIYLDYYFTFGGYIYDEFTNLFLNMDGFFVVKDYISYANINFWVTI